MADLTFYSSIRQGAALAITRQDLTTGTVPHVQLPVSLSYDAESALGGTAAATTLSLLGPGDIVGLDTRAIVRTFPTANDNEAEAGFLCYVDFDQVDLPWRYTPAANAGVIGQKTDQLRPWLTLVVLEEGVQFNPTSDFRPAQGDEKLPQLTVSQRAYLPDLTTVWAWAHVQSQQLFSDAALPGVITGPPGQLVARLLSPRQLDQNRAYTAFLVPTFAGGLAAGQGADAGQIDGLKAAWDGGTTFPLQLPVYYSWRFQTGTVSSFSQAVSELKPVAELPATVGVRAIDVSNPGLLLTSATGSTAPMSMGGALQTPEQALIPDPTLDANWVKGLGLLEDPAKQTSLEVLPPLYGRWYAAQDHLDYPGFTPLSNPPWFKLLNQDPRYRVGAGLGTEVVERDQQALMAAAQEQAAVLNTVNRRRKILQAGREVFTNMVTRHINTGPAAVNSIFLVTAVLHGKIVSCGGGSAPPTVRGILDGSPFGGEVYPWRRLFPEPAGPLIGTIDGGGFVPGPPVTPPGMSTPSTTLGGDAPGGLPDTGISTIINTMSSDQRLYWGVVIFWVARKLLSTQAGKYWWLLRRLLRLGLDLIQLASSQGVTSVTVLEKLRAGTLVGTDILNLPLLNNFTSVTENIPPQPVLSDPTTWPLPLTPPTGTAKDSTQAQAFRNAAVDLFNFVNGTPLPGATIPKADIAGLVSCILSALSPSVTFVEYEKAIHVQTRTITWQAADPLEPILLPPTVAFPMWNRLAAISPDWILPNVGDVPRNSVSLVETNQEFIEAFMVGLNHQVNRELLWNGYPTDQRGTIFQQFWDPSGWTDGGNGRPSSQFMDITEIRSWGPTSALGTHTQRVPNVNHLVLLVRGDVIKRYPNVVVYASKAVIKDPNQPNVITIDDTQQMYPVFQAVLTGDVAYYGFELTQAQAQGSGTTDPGWYFILQEHPHEPKFNIPGQPLANPPNAGPGDYAPQNNNSMPTAAVLAATAYETTTRAAILGRDLLPPSP